MIIQEKKSDVFVIGADTSKQAGISTSKIGKLQYLLTKGLYKDPISAVITEWTNNGVDSVLQAGKVPSDHPVIVTIDKNTQGQYIFSVEDKGTGIDKEMFEQVCMQYLESTKEEDEDALGAWGLGMKSFLSLERSATFTCRKDGIELQYIVYEGKNGFAEYDLIYEKPTTEENGVKAMIVLKDWSERVNFANKARHKLMYYDTAVLIIEGSIVNNDIFRNEHFQWATMHTAAEMHIAFKDVYYAIDWDALGITRINIPIALRIGLSEGLTPTPSRESYISNQETQALILSKIKKVAEYFVERYNENIKQKDKFLDIYNDIGKVDYRVRLNDKEFQINQLLPYSSTKIVEPKCKVLVNLRPSFVKSQFEELFYEYRIAGEIKHNGNYTSKVRWATIGYALRSGYIIIEVSSTPVGNVKEYFKEKYSSNTYFIERHRERLRDKTTTGTLGENADTFDSLLQLSGKTKAEKDALINEWRAVQEEVMANVVDEKDVENDPLYINWLEKKRDKQREERKAKKIRGEYKTLNKQQGEVTIGYARKAKIGNDIVFEKAVYKVADLLKNRYLTVYFTEEDKDRGTTLAKVSSLKNVKFALLGKLEVKKIPQHYQFIKIEKFMNSVHFRKLATALLFHKKVEDFNKIYGSNNGIFKNCLKSVLKDKDAIEQYANQHTKYINGDDIKSCIIDIAKEENLYDRTLWAEYTRVHESLEKFEFITCLKEPYYWNTTELDKYKKLINQMLIFRKKFYGDIPEELKVA